MNENLRVPDPSSELLERAAIVRRSATSLGQLTDMKRQNALIAMARVLKEKSQNILKANLLDCERSEEEGLSKSLLSRLKLSEAKLDQAIEGVLQVAKLSDPIGLRQLSRELSDELLLERVTVFFLFGRTSP